MNKTRSVRIPVSDELLKELRLKSEKDDINVNDATRMMWRDWIAGKIELGTITRDKREKS